MFCAAWFDENEKSRAGVAAGFGYRVNFTFRRPDMGRLGRAFSELRSAANHAAGRVRNHTHLCFMEAEKFAAEVICIGYLRRGKMAIVGSICLSGVLSGCFGKPVTVAPTNLAMKDLKGNYCGDFPDGSRKITLNADGTFAQNVVDTRKKSYHASGKWTLSRPENGQQNVVLYGEISKILQGKPVTSVSLYTVEESNGTFYIGNGPEDSYEKILSR